MKGGFSRFTFDPTKHYAGVLHQQGRVLLDSDWNEEVLERLALLQQEIVDVIGPSGMPSLGSFQILPSVNPTRPDDFQITAGRCYVNGMLCQLDANVSYLTQPDFPDPPAIAMPTGSSSVTALIYLEVWQRLITSLEDDSIREIALGGPDTSARIKTIVQVKAAVLPSSAGVTTCSGAAPFLPVSGSGALTTLQPISTQPQTTCQLPDPSNYTGRENRFYRVQIHDSGDVIPLPLSASSNATSIALSSDAVAGATSVSIASSSALNNSQIAGSLRTGSIVLSDLSGAFERVPLLAISNNGTTFTLVRPLRNSFTVANSAQVVAGAATYKWSRNNAAFGVRVLNVQTDRITISLASLGLDSSTRLRQGDMVEITDDASELGSTRGHLTILTADPDPNQLTAVLADPLPANFKLDSFGNSSRHLVLRRWDGFSDVFETTIGNGNVVRDLGDGVHIAFGGSDLRSGDYWQFAARAIDGSIQPLVNAPPAGTKRSWSPLGVVNWSTSTSSPPGPPPMTILSDCRQAFPSLANFPAADQGVHVSSVLLPSLTAAPSTPLGNDSRLQVTAFTGIDVLCDDSVDPASISRPTCSVVVNTPVDLGGQGAVTAYLPVTLAGTVRSSGNTISWRPTAQAVNLLTQILSQPLTDIGLLARFVLKGNFIWSANNPSSFLDGEAFGMRGSAASIVAPAWDPDHLYSTGDVVLSQQLIYVAQRNNAGVVPGSDPTFWQPFSQTSATAIALTLPSGNKKRGGNFEMWFWLVPPVVMISSISANPSGQIYVGTTSTLTMTLTGPAPTGSSITVTISNISVLQAVTSPPSSPPSATVTVAVAAGATSATLVVTGVAVGQSNVQASFGGQSVATSLSVVPLPVLTGQLNLNPTTIIVGNTSTGSITLSGPAPSSGLSVNLSSSNASVATVPASVTVPAGATSATFTVTSPANGQTGTVTISATASSGGPTLTASLTVNPKPKETKEKEKEKEKEKDTKETKETKEKETKETKDKDTKESKDGKETEKGAMPVEIIQMPPPSADVPLFVADDLGPAMGQAFILAEERPSVGWSILEASRKKEAQPPAARRKKASAPKGARKLKARKEKADTVQFKENPALKQEADRLKAAEVPGTSADPSGAGRPKV